MHVAVGAVAGLNGPTGQLICEPGHSCGQGIKSRCGVNAYQPSLGSQNCLTVPVGYYGESRQSS
jgi:hypothetical protein